MSVGPRFELGGGGYLPLLVRAGIAVDPPDPVQFEIENGWSLDEEEDDSFLVINADGWVYYFATMLDLNDWYLEWDNVQYQKSEATARQTRQDRGVGENSCAGYRNPEVTG